MTDHRPNGDRLSAALDDGRLRAPIVAGRVVVTPDLLRQLDRVDPPPAPRKDTP